jgi:hypothetical protein
MLEINLYDMPTDGNDRDDKNHFQPDLVFGEICLSVSSIQTKHHRQHSAKDRCIAEAIRRRIRSGPRGYAGS